LEGENARTGIVPVMVLFSLFLLSQLWNNVGNLQVGAGYRAQGAHYYLEEASMQEVSDWIKQNTPQTSTVLFTSSSEKMFLYTGRTSHPSLSTMPKPLGHRNKNEVLDSIKQHVDFVVVMPSDTWNNIEPLNSAIMGDAMHFKEVYRTICSPILIVYGVVHD